MTEKELANLTKEQSDALILEGMGAKPTEDDSKTNDKEEEAETDEEEAEEEEESEEDEESEEEETEEEEVDDSDEEQEEEEEPSKAKKKTGIKKVLSQRNEARKEAEEAKSQVQQLQEKLDKLSEDGEFGNEEYVQTLVDKRMAEQDERNDFFDTNSELKEYKKPILSYAKELGIPLEKASKLYLAENNPSLLLGKNDKAKAKSKMFKAPMKASKKLKEGKLDYSDAEFDKLAKEGKIKF